MNYFQPYSLPADQTILAAWDSLAKLTDCPALVNELAKQRELFPRFAAYYAQLRALPRGTRRALLRKLARARELISIQLEWQRKLAGSLAGAALLLALAQSANAATITVTTNVPDINDGDGKCSLIEAIVNANDDAATHPDCVAGSGADTIVLPKKSANELITAYSVASNFPGYSGLPVIESTITIEGNGARITRNATSDFRLIAVGESGDLTLRNTILTGGKARSGGALFNRGVLKITNNKILENIAINGGAITNTGVLSIENSIISGNSAGFDKSRRSAGGGINNEPNGSIFITNSAISNNTAGSLQLYHAWGGGIRNYGYLNIKQSTISGNQAISGYGYYNGNMNPVLGQAYGGGINTGGTVIIENSTISANQVLSRGVIRGAGLFIRCGNVMLVATTVSGNIGRLDDGRYADAGVYNHSCFGDALTISHSVISGNKALEINNHTNSASIVYADNFNLFGFNSEARIVGFTPGPSDITPKKSKDKILGPLKDNGGPTLTHALPRGSPAIDAAPMDANCPGTDQRGVARPQDAGCDIGAVEWTGGSPSSRKSR